ncbi:MAG TPA: serine/threonine-protein kinase [Pirellulales bacterium]|jgi:serine/threonine-protein kinase|nr:serine/threonine-protein kinase [Pirellulales bacterium]
MPKITVEKLIECIERSELIAYDTLAGTLAAWKRSDPAALDDSERLANTFIEAKLLTRWQADSLLQGRSTNFILGNYKLLGMLGHGRSGSVYLGEHVKGALLRAIKVFPVSRAGNATLIARFLNQATAAAKITHPNVEGAFDIAQWKRYQYLVLEYVNGHDLQAIVKNHGPLDHRTAADIIRQAADGLAAMHEKGVIHRDVKPSHLMVDQRGAVKLLDLSLAGFMKDKIDSPDPADDDAIWSTFDYLAPEQAVDVCLIDPRTDIYSFGCVFYFLLTGHAPFASRPMVARLLMHQNPERPDVAAEYPGIPRTLADLCSRMMAKSPEDRPPPAAAVAAILAGILGDDDGYGGAA